jgi:hypothetical protein
MYNNEYKRTIITAATAAEWRMAAEDEVAVVVTFTDIETLQER